MKRELSTLGEILAHDDRFAPESLLYLPMDEVWTLSTRVVVLPHQDSVETPGFSYALGMNGVQDVVANAKAQVNAVSLDQLLQALLFYYDHDAYIRLE